MALKRGIFTNNFDGSTVLADARRSTFARLAPNHLLGIIVVSLFIAAGVAVFAFFLATRSAFDRSGEETVEGISEAVSVYRNDYGVVHITAGADNDAYFGIGYAHAQDRLWQMDFLRRVGRGRLSEMFGRRTLEQDIFLRAMRFDSIASALARHISPESRAVLQAYTNGVNAYLETHQGKIAAEFDALEYQPDSWRVEDCLLVMRLWAWELSSAFTADLVLSAIADTLGRERAVELIPPPSDQDPYFSPCVLDSLLPSRPKIAFVKLPSALDSLSKDSSQVRSTSATVSYHRSRPHNVSAPSIDKNSPLTEKETISHALALVASVRSAASMHGSSLGSNAWAVRSSAFFHPEQDSLGRNFPAKYRHGAILAADAHLALTLPARWYEAHLSSPTLNVIGHTLPGLPFVIVGRNDRIAWSVVNAMVDDADFFAEKLDSGDLRRYYLPDSLGTRISQPFRLVTDTIKVKDSSDAVVDMRYTRRSCVLSDLPYGIKNFPGLQNAVPWRSSLFSASILTRIADSVSRATQDAFKNLTKSECLTFQWTGQQMSDEPLAFLRLAKARSWDDAQSSMAGFAVPAVNCIIAADDGSVGVMPLGIVPQRGGSGHPNLLRKGWEQSEAWHGFTQLSALGVLLNPPSGRVIAANNPISRTKTAAGEVFPDSFLWDTPSRASRIGEFLQDFEHFSIFSMGIVQTDVVSHYAQMLVPTIVRAFENSTTSTIKAAQNLPIRNPSTKLTRTERRALQLVAAWNGALESTSAAASLYTVFLERYAYNTLADDLGEAMYRQYVATTRLPLRSMLSLTQRYTSDDSTRAAWFDKRQTPQVESRDDIIRMSFLEAVAILQQRLATAADIDSVEAWNYGRLHPLTMRHILVNGSEWTRLSLRGVVNAQTVPYSGDATTVASGEWSFNRPFEVAAGSSMRFVCDMSDTLVYMILPSGNTGEIMTRNYSDQRQLWLNGGLLPLPIARSADATFRKHLRLLPKGRD